MAVTQFEANDARSAFPCFDEPEYKATFQLTLTYEKDLLVLNNMPCNGSTDCPPQNSIEFVLDSS